MHKPVKRYIELVGDVKEKEDCLIKLQEAFLMGYQIDWEYFYKGSSCQRLSLPTYPFERKRYWIGHQPIQRDNNREPAIHTDLAASSAIEIQIPLHRYSSIIENH